MELHSIPNIGNAKKKRLGCGPGSGRGKTSGKGHKGQRARAGKSIRPGFEGGQMPLYRRLPHRGFNNDSFRVSYQIVNVEDLLVFGMDAEVTRGTLAACGLIRNIDSPVKLLGSGIVTNRLIVTLDKYSQSARDKIQSAGGTCVLLEA